MYNGYWSYESGAIVKILKLDDSSLKILYTTLMIWCIIKENKCKNPQCSTFYTVDF
ncbi:DUF1911 domain-containing protein [Bacillus thuringiensis]|nr:DUF1911 domain-containing protein [Bacillus thuringiensis]